MAPCELLWFDKLKASLRVEGGEPSGTAQHRVDGPGSNAHAYKLLLLRFFQKRKKDFPLRAFFDRAKVAWRAYGENAGEFVFSHHFHSLKGLPPFIHKLRLGGERKVARLGAPLPKKSWKSCPERGSKSWNSEMQNKWEQLRRKVGRHVTRRHVRWIKKRKPREMMENQYKPEWLDDDVKFC